MVSRGRDKCWYGYASESAIVAAILENAPEEQPATVCTDGYMGGGALYGSKSNKSLYGADRPLGGYSSRHQGGRDQGRNRQVQELLRRAVHHGHDPHKRGGLRRRGGLYRGLPCARELGIRRGAVYIHWGLHTPFADPKRAGVAGYLVRQVPAFDAAPWRCQFSAVFSAKKEQAFRACSF